MCQTNNSTRLYFLRFYFVNCFVQLDYTIMHCCCCPPLYCISSIRICLCICTVHCGRAGGFNHQSKPVILLYKIYPMQHNIPLNVKSDLRWNTNFNRAGCKWSHTKSCCKRAYKGSWKAAVEWKKDISVFLYILRRTGDTLLSQPYGLSSKLQHIALVSRVISAKLT